MIRLICLAGLCVLSAGAAAAAETGLLRVSPEACRLLVTHRPGPDVAYQPGIDARGQAVAPADLPEERLTISFPVIVEIEVDLFRRLGIPVEGRRNYTDRAVLGTVEVDAMGRVTFNHRPLPEDMQGRLAGACSKKTSR